MSNILRIEIRGALPYNCQQDPEMKSILGILNGPCIGWRIKWGRSQRGPINEHGGHTTYYDFVIEGEEAFRWEYVCTIVSCCRRLGVVVLARCMDIEFDRNPKWVII